MYPIWLQHFPFFSPSQTLLPEMKWESNSLFTYIPGAQMIGTGLVPFVQGYLLPGGFPTEPLGGKNQREKKIPSVRPGSQVDQWRLSPVVRRHFALHAARLKHSNFITQAITALVGPWTNPLGCEFTFKTGLIPSQGNKYGWKKGKGRGKGPVGRVTKTICNLSSFARAKRVVGRRWPRIHPGQESCNPLPAPVVIKPPPPPPSRWSPMSNIIVGARPRKNCTSVYPLTVISTNAYIT
ncbi:uncharacterized protein EI90DRAFT_3291038 [Cantharellus anzutake]|uniref:uncharacterized protein n=1 Tax=Cantharellus anzutake TaxID=1750568 RepID=UPI00190833B3|nr:uncharacterized protein EI90DRAFT_3291038 [Cantharellus anzutake]KAF8327163.1 hypothetical protein EI90DRAFT_3291038 [Cantharellus anzutake]